MEHMFKKVLSLSLLISAGALHADCGSGSCGTGSGTVNGAIGSVVPSIVVRSPGANALRRLVQEVGHINKADMDKVYGTLAVTGEYTRSFRNKELTNCLLGSCSLNIQGSTVANRNANALLADYFYLPTDFESTISIDPQIQTGLADFFGFVGLDEWVSGLYAWVQFPVTWSKWNLGFCESNVTAGVANHPAGYFTPNTLARSELLENASSFFKGNAPKAQTQLTSDATSATATRTTTFEGLKCAKICSGDSSDTTVSEVRFALGWNFLLEDDYHLGLNIQASGPSGKKAKHEFLFSVQNGNDGHWELGGAVGGHVILWRSDDEEKNFGFYVDANFTHLFKSCSERCFDLCGKPLSRYMVAEQFTPKASVAAADLVTGGATFATATAANYQFSGNYAPVANVTSFNVETSVNVQADIVAMFNYTHKNWSWDLGYNFWYRGCEKISPKCDNFAANTWALKGDAYVFGFDRGTTVGANATTTASLPLSATESLATINAGTNAGQTNPNTNPKVDGVALAWSVANSHPLQVPRTGTDLQINTSIQPVFIAQSDINFATNKGMSNKVFTDIGYTWNREDYVPYLGVGFEAEFGTNSGDDCGDCNDNECGNCDSDCDNVQGNCVKCSLSQWGVWIKGGVSFN
jgi:hypothetical protein